MQAQQITVKTVYLNPEKKNDKIVDTQGVSWYVPHNLANQLQVGASATVGYEVNNFNGGNLNMVKRVDLNGSAPLQSQPAQQAAPSPAPRQNGNGSSHDRDEQIFVCGVVNNAVSGQQYPTDPASLAQLIRNARQGWKDGWGAPF